jgi:hypothetical protein
MRRKSLNKVYDKLEILAIVKDRERLFSEQVGKGSVLDHLELMDL